MFPRQTKQIETVFIGKSGASERRKKAERRLYKGPLDRARSPTRRTGATAREDNGMTKDEQATNSECLRRTQGRTRPFGRLRGHGRIAADKAVRHRTREFGGELVVARRQLRGTRFGIAWSIEARQTGGSDGYEQRRSDGQWPVKRYFLSHDALSRRVARGTHGRQSK